MRSNSYLVKYFLTVSLFFNLGVGIIFHGCSSSDSPMQSSTGPSNVSGTVFETPLEFDAGENPLSIASGDFNLDNKTDFVVASSRKQNGISTSAEYFFFQQPFPICFKYNFSNNRGMETGYGLG